MAKPGIRKKRRDLIVTVPRPDEAHAFTGARLRRVHGDPAGVKLQVWNGAGRRWLTVQPGERLDVTDPDNVRRHG